MYTPYQLHLLDCSQHAGLSRAAPAAIAQHAQQCWHALCASQPASAHVVLAHAGSTGDAGALGNTEGTHQAAQVYMVAAQAQGWLYAPPQSVPLRWQASSAAALRDGFAQAQARGFCAADCAVLAIMAALAALHTPCSTVPGDFVQQAHCFPCLSRTAPIARPHAFAALPRSVRQAGHAHGLYAVMGTADWVLRCMQAGAKVVQLRSKQPTSSLHADIVRCAQAAQQHGALFFVNDHWQAALQCQRHHNLHGLYGVHLGQEDLHALTDEQLDALHSSGLRLGLSTHSLWELAAALHVRPSYVACGPIHATTTKTMPWQPLGDANIAWWAHIVHAAALPLVAIGGMTPPRAQSAVAAGADMVAVVSHITQAQQPAEAMAQLQTAIAHGQCCQHSVPDWPVPTLR